jgi:Icc-related predicted phosphoesterase
MKLVCISDTHERLDRMKYPMPAGDILVHAGDLTMRGSIPTLAKAAEWFKTQPYKHKVVIAGNHDFGFQNANHDVAVKLFEDAGVTYLQDKEVTIDGVKFYGSPWQPWFHNWAFNLQRGKDIAIQWAKIPDDVNVLITHGPPFKIRDLVEPSLYRPAEHVGCEDLLKRINQLKSLKYHIFGHIHSGYGVEKVGDVTFVNASTCTEAYDAENPPIVVEV